jgi:hypothetical protein
MYVVLAQERIPHGLSGPAFEQHVVRQHDGRSAAHPEHMGDVLQETVPPTNRWVEEM